MTVELVKDTETVQKLVEKFEGVLDAGTDANGIPLIIVPADKIRPVMFFLRDEQKYDYFNTITAAEDDNFYISIYTIYAVLDYSKRRIHVKVNLPKELPVVPSIEDIYPAADWNEREAYDLMGIIYEGHHSLTRILTTDDWVGHTLRKDYQMVEPESYVSILKKETDEHVIKGIERMDPYKAIKPKPPVPETPAHKKEG